MQTRHADTHVPQQRDSADQCRQDGCGGRVDVQKPDHDVQQKRAEGQQQQQAQPASINVRKKTTKSKEITNAAGSGNALKGQTPIELQIVSESVGTNKVFNPATATVGKPMRTKTTRTDTLS